MPSLEQMYRTHSIPALQGEFGMRNALAVPRVQKVVVSVGIGKFVVRNPQNANQITDEAILAVGLVAGQKPKVVGAKTSVAGFSLRQGTPVAVSATLRGKRMWEFLERFLTYALPRARDFKGIQTSHLDERGNLNLGFREISIFPETALDKIKTSFGFQVTIVGTGKTKEMNLALYRQLGFPIRS